MLINCKFARGFKPHFFRMLLFHMKELYFRLFYYVISCFCTLLIFYTYKTQILFFIAPLNLYFSNLISVFWYFFILAGVLSLIWNLPLLLYHLLYFFKTALYQQEYFQFKQNVQFILISTVFCSYFYYFVFLPALINFTSSFNTEHLSMQISFLSFVYFNFYMLMFLTINTFVLNFLSSKRLNRFIVYFFLFILILLIANLDLFNLTLLFTIYIGFSETTIFFNYLFINKGL